ncbi:MAG: GNAT family N-acetyltransferase [Burkholderiales bacterium]|nr:GNAT family N-acetyltransferase [Burkholderiales bacterium]
MTINPPFVIRPVNWQATRDQLDAIRRNVFIEEQNVPEELEWDGLDERSYHVLALSGEGEPIGTGRLLLDGHIGRMAVLRPWRRQGVGSAILRALLVLAQKEGHDTVRLNAQVQAIGFYEKHGFKPLGKPFMDAGIPHRAMKIELKSLPGRIRRAE